MKQKQWKILLAVMVGVLGVTGCGNKAETGSIADDAVAVMADAATDGETSLDFPTEGQTAQNITPKLPQAFYEIMEANFSRVQVAIKTAEATNAAVLKAESERKEAEAKEAAEKAEAEARAAEEKAQAEVTAQPAPSASTVTYNVVTEYTETLEAGNIYSIYDLLPLVNADRANNGVAELQWSDSLAQYCADRIPVVDYNREHGIWAHEGATKTENLTLGGLTSDEANQDWINSEGHHNSRINSGYTMYAAATYMNPETGNITWIEAFE